MKKYDIFIYLIVIILVFILFESMYKYIYNNNYKPSYKNYYETLIYPNEKEIIYNEEYALNTTIYIYRKLYNKPYTKDDFIVDDIGWLDYSCWHVYLNKNSSADNGIVFTYDLPEGLIIYKKTGAILANYGEVTT